ncbi:hypothetical protein SDC9_128865 [bioreactor metagenome]|uniref:Uncharacterized protein n=1 Tax=bioreactor metagenome TaxID=1076179 RepID=A0A645CY99_9ZZZZ
MCCAVTADRFQFFFGILGEDIDGNNQWHIEFFNILYVFFEINKAFFYGFYIRCGQGSFWYTAVHFKSTNCSNKYDSIGFQSGIAAFDIKKLLGAKISTETCLSDSIFSKLHRCFRCHNAVTAMCYIGERPAVNDCRYILQCLHQIRFNGISQKGCHCALCFNHAGSYWFTGIAIGHNNFAEAFFQIFQAIGETQDSHYFGSNRDIKAILTRHAMRLATQSYDDITQFTIVHVYYTFPDNPTRIYIQEITLLDMIVQHSGK